MRLVISKSGHPALLGTSLLQVCAVALLAACSLIVFGIFWFSQHLRPIADDYSIGVFAASGILGGSSEWAVRYSGDITTIFLNILLVGWPLVHLPFSAASAIPFIFTSLAACAPLVLAVTQLQGRRWVAVLCTTPVLLVSYWAYWWVSAESETFAYSRPEALSASLWQNVSVSYLATVSLIVTAWIALEASRRPLRSALFLRFILGVVAGLAGPVIAASTITVAIFLLLIRSVEANRLRTYATAGYLLIAAGSILGAIGSYLSPGTQARLQLLPRPRLSFELVWALLTEMGDSIGFWLQGVLTPGALTAFVLAAGATYIATTLRVLKLNSSVPLDLGIIFFIAALILTIFSQTSEVFAYDGYWHILPARLLSWWAVTAIGIAAGQRLARMQEQGWLPVLVCVTLTGAILASLSGVIEWVNVTSQRSIVWQNESAPVPPLYDRESPEVQQRWERLIESRAK